MQVSFAVDSLRRAEVSVREGTEQLFSSFHFFISFIRNTVITTITEKNIVIKSRGTVMLAITGRHQSLT